MTIIDQEPIPGKATVLKVGEVEVRLIAPAKTMLTLNGWEFDCRNEVPDFSADDDGNLLMYGYTSEEILEIRQRASEWV